MPDSGENTNPGGHENQQPNNKGRLHRAWICVCYWWRRTIRGLKKVDALITAVATVLLFAITGLLTLVAYWQYSDPTLKDTLIASNRAWLAPTFAEQSAKRGQPLRYKIMYSNPGKDPATGFGAQEQIGMVNLLAPQASLYTVFKKEILEDVCGRTGAGKDGLVVYPSSGARDHTYTVETAAVPEIENRTKLGFIHGCFAYFTFGVERKSEYCFLFLLDGPRDFKGVNCPYGNNVHEPEK